MHGRAEKLRLLRRNGSIRHAGKPFLKPFVYRLHSVVQIAHERLRLKDAVDKPVAVAVAERADARIQHAVYRAEVHRNDLCLVFIKLAERARGETNLRAVLYQREKQIALRRALDAPFRRRGEDAAAADPRLVVVFLKGKNPDAGVVWLNVRIVRVLKTTEGTARLNHLLVEPLNLALKQLVRI